MLFICVLKGLSGIFQLNLCLRYLCLIHSYPAREREHSHSIIWSHEGGAPYPTHPYPAYHFPTHPTLPILPYPTQPNPYQPNPYPNQPNMDTYLWLWHQWRRAVAMATYVTAPSQRHLCISNISIVALVLCEGSKFQTPSMSLLIYWIRVRGLNLSLN